MVQLDVLLSMCIVGGSGTTARRCRRTPAHFSLEGDDLHPVRRDREIEQEHLVACLVTAQLVRQAGLDGGTGLAAARGGRGANHEPLLLNRAAAGVSYLQLIGDAPGNGGEADGGVFILTSGSQIQPCPGCTSSDHHHAKQKDKQLFLHHRWLPAMSRIKVDIEVQGLPVFNIKTVG